MTKFKRHLALSTTAMLIASLAACSKHTLRENTKVPALSTSANPLKAEAEDKAAAKKAEEAATATKGEDGRELTEAEKDEALIALKKASDARAAAKGLSVDQVADMFAADVDGAKIVESSGQAAGAADSAKPAGTDDTTAPAKAADVALLTGSAETPAAGTAVADSPTAPIAIDIAKPGADIQTGMPAKTTSVPGSKLLQIVLPVPGSRTGTVAGEVQTAPIAAVPVADQAAVKRAFVKAMIQPTLHMNAKTIQQRQRVEAAKKKIADKAELTDAEKADMAKMKLDYLLEDKASLDDLLMRVDSIQMSFLIAPLALKTKWNTESQVTEALIASRIQELNSSAADDKVRFRSARLALQNATGVVHGVELMKSFLAYNAGDKNATHDAVMATVIEIAAISQEPEMAQEIERARASYVEQEARLRVKPQDRN